jgi:hypothetical protein
MQKRRSDCLHPRALEKADDLRRLHTFAVKEIDGTGHSGLSDLDKLIAEFNLQSPSDPSFKQAVFKAREDLIKRAKTDMSIRR